MKAREEMRRYRNYFKGGLMMKDISNKLRPKKQRSTEKENKWKF